MVQSKIVSPTYLQLEKKLYVSNAGIERQITYDYGLEGGTAED